MVTQLFEIATVLRQGLPAETEVQAGIATESPKRVGLCVAGLEVNSPVAPHHATNK